MSDELFFPSFPGPGSMRPLVAGILCITLVVVGYIIGSWDTSRVERRRWCVSTTAAGIAAMVSGFIVLVWGASQVWVEYDGIQKSRDSFISGRGVYIPDSQMENLEFPKYRPTEDEKFGIAQAEYEGKVISVFLTWEDDELKLYRTTGQELLPLD